MFKKLFQKGNTEDDLGLDKARMTKQENNAAAVDGDDMHVAGNTIGGGNTGTGTVGNGKPQRTKTPPPPHGFRNDKADNSNGNSGLNTPKADATAKENGENPARQSGVGAESEPPVDKFADDESVDTEVSGEDPNQGRMVRLSVDGDLRQMANVRPDAPNQPGKYKEEDSEMDGEGVVNISKTNDLRLDIGYCSRAGWEPKPAPNGRPYETIEVRKINQDAYCIHAPLHRDAKNQVFLGVFDGHGADGRYVSHCARDKVFAMLVESCKSSKFDELANADASKRAEAHRAVSQAFTAAYSAAERELNEPSLKIEHLYSGCTGISVWFHGPDLYCACVGDSRAVLGRSIPSGPGGKEKFKAIGLSYDQKPTRPDERKRIRAAGGRIARWRRNLGPLRVWIPRDWIPGLAMTRSIGDTILTEYGVIPVPEISYIRLAQYDSFVVLASDGVWEFMTSEEVIEFVGNLKKNGTDATEAADCLVREAVRRWRRQEEVVDDTTAIVVYLDGDSLTKSTGASASSSKPGFMSLLGFGGAIGDKAQLVTPTGALQPFTIKNDVGGSN